MRLPAYIGIILILVAVLLLASVLAAASRRRRADADPWPYFAQRPLTAPEQALYFRLVRALPQCIVLCQVQVSRVLGVQKGHDFNAWNDRISRLGYDFVVCAKDAAVLGVIELDDPSHDRADRREADERKARATAAAGIPLHRWNVDDLPSEEAIKVAFVKPQQLPIETSRSGEHSLLRVK